MFKKRLLLFVIMGVLICGVAVGLIVEKTHAAGSTFYVNPDTGNDLWDGTSAKFVSGTTGPVATIGRAITLAANSDTIVLAATDFTDIGAINVNKSLTIKSYAGTWNSTFKTKITGDSRFTINAADVSITGIIFDGIDAANIAVLINNFNHVFITYCKFTNLSNYGVYADESTYGLISDNVFSEITSGIFTTGAYTDATVGMNIYGNRFLNIDDMGLWDLDSQDLLIDSNTFYNIADGAMGFNGSEDTVIMNNTMSHCNYTGGLSSIILWASTLLGTTNIADNHINDSTATRTGTAVGTDATNFAGGVLVYVNYNDLSSNTLGIAHAGTGAINAQYNWWGSSTGPLHATSNPNGLGSATTNNVEIDIAPYQMQDYWSKSQTITGNVTSVVYKSRLYQVRRDKYNHLYTRYSHNGHSWTAWTYGGHAYSDVAMVVNGSALYQAVKGTGGGFYRRYTTNGVTWNNWKKSGSTIGKISLLAYNNNLYQVKVISGNKAYMKINNGSWVSIGTSLGPVDTINFPPGIIQAKIAANHYVYWRSSANGVDWSAWTKDGGMGKNVTIAAFDAGFGLELYMTKVALNGSFYYRGPQPGPGLWTPWTKSGAGSGKPSMLALDDRLYQTKRVSSNNYIRYSYDGSTWTNWQNDHNGSGDTTMVEFSSELYRALRGVNGYLYTTHM